MKLNKLSNGSGAIKKAWIGKMSVKGKTNSANEYAKWDSQLMLPGER